MQRRASMTVLFLTVFIDLIGFGIVLPLLPFFAKHFGVSGLMVALLSSVFSCMQFVCAPFWGRLSDRIGRRPVLLLSLAGSTLSYLLLGFCTAYWQIFASRILAGFFGANIAVANAYIADITPPEQRSRGMGLIGAAFGLGFVLGPGIGALIAYLAENPDHPARVYQAIGWVAAAICGINFLVACGTLVESRSPESRAASQPLPAERGFAYWRRVLAMPLVGFLIALYFVLGFGFSNFETLFALLIHRHFGFDVKEGNCFFLFIGLVVAMVQGGLIGRLVKLFGERRLIVLGCALFSTGLVLIPYATRVWHLLVGLAVLGIGQGLNRSTILGLVSQQIGPDEQGGVMGLVQSSGSLARIIGPLAGGWLFDHAGAAVPFVLGGVLVMLTLVAGSGFLLPERRNAPA